MNKESFYAVSRKDRKVERLTGFSCWEAVQNAFLWGIVLRDGTKADAIGRQPWAKVCKYAIIHGYKIL